MKTSLCVLSGLALALFLSPAARCENYSGRQLSQKPAAAAAPAAPTAAPQIKSLNPTEVAAGEKLTVLGTNLSGSPKDNTVYIGEKGAQVQSTAAGSVTVLVPKDVKAGKQKVTITVRGAKSNAMEVTVIGPPPELDSLSLTSASPGASLTLSGKNFSPNAHENKVTIGGAQADVTSASTSSISVMIPHNIESPQEAQVSVEVGKQKAKTSLPLQIQSREY